ncbi:hypothetical protein KIN20_020786 [Parelaphostrongylus tenuis]|uniref:Uncharacterized protein n=1 Tax=Parelaphostrongylus tenuis TaxID=148309 RepID=A0AAD5QR35_PARTN|nr:hypothetical protein KIN20_020786 [Parelaphostrongylus tenuis]
MANDPVRLFLILLLTLTAVLGCGTLPGEPTLRMLQSARGLITNSTVTTVLLTRVWAGGFATYCRFSPLVLYPSDRAAKNMSSRTFTATGFSLPTGMVYSESGTAADVAGMSRSADGARAFVMRIVLKAVRLSLSVNLKL